MKVGRGFEEPAGRSASGATRAVLQDNRGDGLSTLRTAATEEAEPVQHDVDGRFRVARLDRKDVNDVAIAGDIVVRVVAVDWRKRACTSERGGEMCRR